MVPDFFSTYHWDKRPFLLCGMGPSFSRLHDYDISGFNILGINKVVRQIPVDICHIIDYYIVDKVKDSIEKQAKHLVIPYYPHFGCRPHTALTMDLISMNMPPVLKSKLSCYNLSTSWERVGQSPIIFAKYFTAEASLNLIANLGCKEVKAIGIDGGKGERAKEFSDHGPADPRGFDLQWESISNTIVKYGINYSNLDGSPLNSTLQELLNAKVQKVV